jgi:hypothetical protein
MSEGTPISHSRAIGLAAFWALGAIALVLVCVYPLHLLNSYCAVQQDQDRIEKVLQRLNAKTEQPEEQRRIGVNDSSRPFLISPSLYGGGGYDQPESGRESPREEHESWWSNFLCSVNGSDYALAVFTFLLFVSTGLLWYVTERSLAHAQIDSERQARDMQKSLGISKQAADAAIAGQRPWLQLIVKLDGSFGLKEEGIWPGISVRVKNVGNSPATHVQVAVVTEVEPAFADGEQIDWVRVAISKAKRSFQVGDEIDKSDADKVRIFGDVFFPAEDRPPTMPIYSMSTNADIRRAVSDGGGRTLVTVYLVVAADYRFAGGRGSTIATFAIEPQNREGFFDRFQKEYIVGEIFLRPSFVHWYAT